MLNGFLAVYKANLDLIVYVIGGSQQNELMLSCVLDTYFETLSEILKYEGRYDFFLIVVRPQMDKQAFLESYEQALLALDEIVDRG